MNFRTIQILNKLETLLLSVPTKMLIFKRFVPVRFHLTGCSEICLESKQLFLVVLLLSATFRYGFSMVFHLLAYVFTIRSTSESRKLYEVDLDFSPLNVLFTQQFYSVTIVGFRQLNISELLNCTLTSSQFRDP